MVQYSFTRPRKPDGSLGRTAQDGHLDSHTAPELYIYIYIYESVVKPGRQGACCVGSMRMACVWLAGHNFVFAF